MGLLAYRWGGLPLQPGRGFPISFRVFVHNFLAWRRDFAGSFPETCLAFLLLRGLVVTTWRVSAPGASSTNEP